MNRQLTSVFVTVLGLSMLTTIYIESVVEPRTVEYQQETMCYFFEPYHLENLQDSNVDISYENNQWLFNNRIVGYSDFEDEGFLACAEKVFIEKIYEQAQR
jgi:hypothetical protein